MASRIYDWLDSRLKLKSVERTLLDEPIPGGASWVYVFGSATLFLFILQAITGMFLAIYYAPTPDHAYDSVRFIETQVAFEIIDHGIKAAVLVVRRTTPPSLAAPRSCRPPVAASRSPASRTSG